MMSTKKSIWRALLVIGLLGGAGLYVQARLPMTELIRTLLLIGWVILFYAGLAVWMGRNGEMLEQEPPALDAVGRPVIDNDAPVYEVEPERREAHPHSASYPFQQSEAI